MLCLLSLLGLLLVLLDELLGLLDEHCLVVLFLLLGDGTVLSLHHLLLLRRQRGHLVVVLNQQLVHLVLLQGVLLLQVLPLGISQQVVVQKGADEVALVHVAVALVLGRLVLGLLFSAENA